MLNQKLQQKLLQKLSPQQIQLMKLLQLPSIALEQRIKQEIEENPALEEGHDDSEDMTFEDDYSYSENDGDENESENDIDKNTDRDDDFSLSDYIGDDEIPDYKTYANNSSSDDEPKSIPFSIKKSFHENLLEQLSLKPIDEREQQIASYMIGNIDDSGYLKRNLESMVDDLVFSLNISTDLKELETLLKVIQDLDPAGVGARNLQECLILQLQRKDYDSDDIDNAIKILETNFDDFSKKHYEKILKRHNLSEKQLKAAIDEILTLNPKPGNSLSDTSKSSEYIIPDFIVTNEDGKLELILNAKNAPELRINRTYSEMIKTFAESKDKNDKKQKEALLFVKQKIDSAKWFIDAIRQRQQTLIYTMQAILDYQYSFFLSGDETHLKPMILKDISEKVNLDISTISRVVNSKYVQTPFGTFLLKSFFSESMEKEDGELVSTIEIKNILKSCIDNEDKRNPITDDTLTKVLKEKGYNIARRTIAKYREQLNIPVARLRKEL